MGIETFENLFAVIKSALKIRRTPMGIETRNCVKSIIRPDKIRRTPMGIETEYTTDEQAIKYLFEEPQWGLKLKFCFSVLHNCFVRRTPMGIETRYSTLAK